MKYAERLNDLLTKYKRIFVVEADNVLSGQMHDVRGALRGRADIIMGKNTLMRKIIRQRYEADPNSQANQNLYESFVQSSVLTGNVGFVMTNEPISDILEVLGRYKVNAAARVGAIAPIDVIVPAGKTGLDPTQTHFFLALNIQTKIEQSQVTMLKDFVALRAGDKVGPSEAKLLLKMKMKPFMYGLETKFVYDDGTLFPRAAVGVSDEDLGDYAAAAVADVAALSLETGVVTAPAITHNVIGAFKDVLSIAFACDSSFEDFGADSFITAVKEGKVAAAPAAGAGAAAAADRKSVV